MRAADVSIRLSPVAQTGRLSAPSLCQNMRESGLPFRCHLTASLRSHSERPRKRWPEDAHPQVRGLHIDLPIAKPWRCRCGSSGAPACADRRAIALRRTNGASFALRAPELGLPRWRHGGLRSLVSDRRRPQTALQLRSEGHPRNMSRGHRWMHDQSPAVGGLLQPVRTRDGLFRGSVASGREDR